MFSVKKSIRPWIFPVFFLIFLWSLRFLLPLVLPFLLGLAMALLAMPLTRFFRKHLGFSSALAGGLAITGVYALLLGSLYGLGKFLFLELDRLGALLPAFMEQVKNTVQHLEVQLEALIARAPEALRPGLSSGLSGFWESGAALLQGFLPKLCGFLSRLLWKLPDVLIFLGTSVVSSFLLAARLPKCRFWLSARLPQCWKERLIPLLHTLKANCSGWLRAQGIMAVLCAGVLTLGFWIFGFSRPWLLGPLISLVDALPMLGTGTILLPWGCVLLFTGNTWDGLGLWGLYGLTALGRNLLEPRLLGHQLGLSPLVTLAAIYVGYRLWGIWGMLLTPMLTVSFLELWAEIR